MLRYTVTYDQFKNMRAVFGARFTVAYTMSDDASGFFAVASAEGQPFIFQHIADTRPATFPTDFPAAIRVQAIDM